MENNIDISTEGFDPNRGLERAIDLIETGDVNFTILGADQSSNFAISSLSISSSLPTNGGYMAAQSSSNGPVRGGGLLGIMPSEQFFYAGPNIGAIYHEMSHFNEDIDSFIESETEDSSNGLNNLSDMDRIVVQNIIEEKIIRDAIEGMNDFHQRNISFRQSTDIESIIDSYATIPVTQNGDTVVHTLSDDALSLLRNYIENDYEKLSFELDGVIYAPNANGEYEPVPVGGVNRGSGFEDVSPPTFWDRVADLGEAVTCAPKTPPN